MTARSPEPLSEEMEGKISSVSFALSQAPYNTRHEILRAFAREITADANATAEVAENRALERSERIARLYDQIAKRDLDLLASQESAKAKCECGADLLPGRCSGHCDNDE